MSRPLIEQLRHEPHSFDLFQAISLVERAYPQRRPVGCGNGRDEALQLVADIGLAFLPSDIAALASNDRPGPPLTLRSGVLSLGGAQGPLPLVFTDMLLAAQRAGNPAGRDFLDIFHQRLLGLLYRSRRKHHLALQPGSWQQAPLPRVLDALSGLGRGQGAAGPGGERAWLRHAGLQGAAPRSMATLLSLLRDRLGLAFEGRSFVGRWQPLAARDQARVSVSRLGEGTSLGQRTWDQEAGIELSAPALDEARYASLLPGAAGYALLHWLVVRHLQRDLRVCLTLSLARRPSTRLGRGGSLAPRLGLSAWLGGGQGSWQGARLVLGFSHDLMRGTP